MIDSPQIESHLQEIYTVLASNVTINEKLNALIYFESIIDNSNVSNRLINSAFVQLLVKLLKSVKSPGVKQRLCSVLGLLVRHSTVIDNELAESEICSTLVEVMEERSEKVRRRAIAALGEYMFYAATQLDEDNFDPVWDLSQGSIDLLVKCLKIGEEDDIVRFYACKTLENICAQSNRAGQKFATAESLNHLIAIYVAHQNQLMRTIAIDSHTATFLDAIRTSAAVALSHICRLKP
jgi:serine/threonine-protein kinase ULK4